MGATAESLSLRGQTTSSVAQLVSAPDALSIYVSYSPWWPHEASSPPGFAFGHMHTHVHNLSLQPYA